MGVRRGKHKKRCDRKISENCYDPTSTCFAVVVRKLLTSAWNQRIRVWTGDRLDQEWSHGRSPPNYVAWSPDGKRIAFANDDGIIRLCSFPDGRQLGSLSTTGDTGTAAFTAGGQRSLLSPDLENQLRYTVEQPDGSWRTLSVAEFDQLVKSGAAK